MWKANRRAQLSLLGYTWLCPFVRNQAADTEKCEKRIAVQIWYLLAALYKRMKCWKVALKSRHVTHFKPIDGKLSTQQTHLECDSSKHLKTVTPKRILPTLRLPHKVDSYIWAHASPKSLPQGQILCCDMTERIKIQCVTSLTATTLFHLNDRHLLFNYPPFCLSVLVNSTRRPAIMAGLRQSSTNAAYIGLIQSSKSGEAELCFIAPIHKLWAASVCHLCPCLTILVCIGGSTRQP